MKRRSTLWCLWIVTLLLVPVTPADALELSGTGLVASPAFVPEVGDEVVVLFANTGPRPVRVQIRLVRADDFSEIDTSEQLLVGPGAGIQEIMIPADFPVLVLVRYRAQGRTSGQISLQVRDAAGTTKIFADGFESGDTSAW